MPILSAVICTYNRPQRLRNSIQSLIDQSLQKDMYEIIVIDNSASKTAYNVVAEFKDSEYVRYVHEPTIGLSHARNIGFKNARGAYVAYLDDDAAAEKDWLLHIHAAFTETNAVCVGGKVELVLEVAKPLWLPDELLCCLSKLSCAESPVIINGTNHYLHGCNIAFKKEALIEAGGFNTNLGRVGASLISGEDALVQKKIQDGGGVCLYCQDIVVYHHIEKERLTKKWFLRRMFSEGVSLARMRTYEEHLSVLKRLSIAVFEFSHFLSREIKKLVRGEISHNDASLFAQKCKSRRDIGYIMGFMGAR